MRAFWKRPFLRSLLHVMPEAGSIPALCGSIVSREWFCFRPAAPSPFEPLPIARSGAAESLLPTSGSRIRRLRGGNPSGPFPYCLASPLPVNGSGWYNCRPGQVLTRAGIGWCLHSTLPNSPLPRRLPLSGTSPTRQMASFGVMKTSGPQKFIRWLHIRTCVTGSNALPGVRMKFREPGFVL